MDCNGDAKKCLAQRQRLTAAHHSLRWDRYVLPQDKERSQCSHEGEFIVAIAEPLSGCSTCQPILYPILELMISECIILADRPGTLIEVCGISTLERLLRTLQRCGIERATVLSSTPKAIAQELAAPSWARVQLHVTLRARPDGAVTIEQIVDNWPDNRSETSLLLIIPAHSVFDPRLLRALVAQNSPAALVDSSVRPRIQ